MKSAIGKARMVLGNGSSGMFAHATLRVSIKTGNVDSPVNWSSDLKDLDSSIVKRCEDYLKTWVDGYRDEDGIELCIEVLDIQTDTHRRNDYERGLNVALRDALEQLNVPTPQIFGG